MVVCVCGYLCVNSSFLFFSSYQAGSENIKGE